MIIRRVIMGTRSVLVGPKCVITKWMKIHYSSIRSISNRIERFYWLFHVNGILRCYSDIRSYWDAERQTKKPIALVKNESILNWNLLSETGPFYINFDYWKTKNEINSSILHGLFWTLNCAFHLILFWRIVWTFDEYLGLKNISLK